MLPQLFWLSGSAIFLVLGGIHLYYTFFTNKFDARNSAVTDEMKNISPVLTSDTTMWKAWIGFNASHSAGAIFIGLINITLATKHLTILADSKLIMILTIVTAAFYCWLGKNYWFRTPYVGIVAATCCFMIAALINYFS